jgi:hypothetical protein
MKRTMIILLVLGLLAGSLSSGATAAKKKKKKKKAKPVATSLYFHGSTDPVDDTGSTGSAYLKMDTKKPTESAPKSKQILNYVRGPNTMCAGNNLFPVWTGSLKGTVKGDMKVTFDTVASPAGQVEIEVWPDVMSQLCTNETLGVDDYIEPAGEVTVDLPPGPGVVEATIKGVNFKAIGSMMVQITPILDTPFFGRVLYDTPDMDAHISFKCVPVGKAKKCA